MTIIDPTHRKKLAEIELLERKLELRRDLPHIHGFRLYKWQREFIESRNRVSLLCAGNQIGKSSSNILKWIHWATEPSLWPSLWPHRRPQQFWILMPTKDMITTEFRTKWEAEFLPKGTFKRRGQYAWEPEFRNKYLWAIHFTGTGISCYMHTYEQDVHHLQAGTVDAMFVDEEPDYLLMPELLMRLAATNGYFNAVMTPTRGQDQWRRAFEVRGEGELFQGAYKRRVSVFDCMKYEDGGESAWTLDRINQMMNQLGTQQEIDLRIYGKFVAQEGLKVPSFDRDRNIKPKVEMGKDTLWYSGVDIGSGGQAHPPAIVFVGVKPTYNYGAITTVWKGDSRRNYTVTDIIDKYVELRAGRQMAGEYYDYASAEFGLVSGRTGLNFQRAEKGHDIGFPLLNSLFKNQMMDLVDNEGAQYLINELVTVRHDTKKINDDALDALRYAVAKIPWNFEGVTGEKMIVQEKKPLTQDEQRRGLREAKPRSEESIDDEIAEWNSMFDVGEDDVDW